MPPQGVVALRAQDVMFARMRVVLLPGRQLELAWMQHCWPCMREGLCLGFWACKLSTCLQVERTYQAIVLGQPPRAQGRVETNVGRDVQDRKKMAAFAYMSNRHALAGLQWCKAAH